MWKEGPFPPRDPPRLPPSCTDQPLIANPEEARALANQIEKVCVGCCVWGYGSVGGVCVGVDNQRFVCWGPLPWRGDRLPHGDPGSSVVSGGMQEICLKSHPTLLINCPPLPCSGPMGFNAP